MHTSSAILLYFLGQTTGAYVWPSKTDFLEDLLAIQTGYRRFGFTDLVVPCGFGDRAGIQNAAEWMRTAFHDMATFDAATGTGGLDASLQFELDRPENLGSAFNNTFNSMHDFITPRSSVSDLIALSLVAASAGCGGPKVPLRTGRIDAMKAGPAGVPKPEDDLESTQKTFSKAGFSNEDMITMVACGHSLGNIHSLDFPEMVEGEPAEANVAHFDSTPGEFDNVVVTEYLGNSTKNPLVVGKNETMNSDKRIFESDGNKTMSSLANASTFQSKCGEIFERLINTVPSSVTLSDPVEIVDVKPYVDISLQDDGALLLQGQIRIRNVAEKHIDGDDLEVHLIYRDRSDAVVNDQIVAARARLRGGQSYGFWHNTFTWFEFSTLLNASTAISSFNIQLKTLSSGVTTVLDNEGTGGYPVTSELLYQQSDSCITFNGDEAEVSVSVAMLKDARNATQAPSLLFYHRVARQGVALPKLEIETITFQEKDGVERSGYQYFEAKVSTTAQGWSTVFDIVGADGKSVLDQKTNALPQTCKT